MSAFYNKHPCELVFSGSTGKALTKRKCLRVIWLCSTYQVRVMKAQVVLYVISIASRELLVWLCKSGNCKSP